MVVLLGPPGSGKGTQAKLLAERDNFLIFSTGDLIRKEIKKNTELGSKMKEFVDRGELVPDEYLLNLLINFISTHLSSESYNRLLFDGFPRNLAQDEIFKNTLHELLGNNYNFIAIFLEVSDSTILNRLIARNRADDTKEIILNRLKVYNKETYPLVTKYEKEGRLRIVDGEKEIEDVYSSIKEILNDYFKN